MTTNPIDKNIYKHNFMGINSVLDAAQACNPITALFGKTYQLQAGKDIHVLKRSLIEDLKSSELVGAKKAQTFIRTFFAVLGSLTIVVPIISYMIKYAYEKTIAKELENQQKKTETKADEKANPESVTHGDKVEQTVEEDSLDLADTSSETESGTSSTDSTQVDSIAREPSAATSSSELLVGNIVEKTIEEVARSKFREIISKDFGVKDDLFQMLEKLSFFEGAKSIEYDSANQFTISYDSAVVGMLAVVGMEIKVTRGEQIKGSIEKEDNQITITFLDESSFPLETPGFRSRNPNVLKSIVIIRGHSDGELRVKLCLKNKVLLINELQMKKSTVVSTFGDFTMAKPTE